MKANSETAKIVGKNLRRLLSMQDKSQKDMCDALKLTRSTASSWVNGARMPSMETLDVLASYLGVTRMDLLEEPGSAKTSRAAMIPVYSSPAGDGSLGSVVRNIVINPEMDPDAHFAILVSDGEMEPTLRPGDIAIIKKQDTAADGDLVLISVNGLRPVIRRWHPTAGSTFLVTDKPGSWLTAVEPSSVRVLGKVVESRRCY